MQISSNLLECCQILYELGIKKKILRNVCRVAFSYDILTVGCSPNVTLVGWHVALENNINFCRESANVPKHMPKIAAQYLYDDIRGVYDLKLKKKLYQF